MENKKTAAEECQECQGTYFTPTRMAIRQIDNSKYCPEYGEIGTLIHCWWECKMMQLLWKTVLAVPQNVKH